MAGPMNRKPRQAGGDLDLDSTRSTKINDSGSLMMGFDDSMIDSRFEIRFDSLVGIPTDINDCYLFAMVLRNPKFI